MGLFKGVKRHLVERERGEEQREQRAKQKKACLKRERGSWPCVLFAALCFPAGKPRDSRGQRSAKATVKETPLNSAPGAPRGGHCRLTTFYVSS